MSALGWASAALVAIGALVDSPGPLVVGLLGLLAEGVRAVWARFGLDGLEYERHLESDRLVCGDVVRLDLTVRNRKPLPLAWLRASDAVSGGLAVQERRLVAEDRTGDRALVNTWSVGAYERVVRHLHLVAERRGTYAIGPVRLAVGDPFAREAAAEERPGRSAYLVRPRMVQVRETAPPRAWVGPRRARRGPLEQSLLFAGVRPYQAGDPLRRVHWRATARTAQPQVKRFDPALEPDTLIALDVATPVGDLAIGAFDEDLVEGLCVAAASLARRLLADGIACGLAVAAFTGVQRRSVLLAPGTAPGQLGRLADLLARVTPVSSARFEELLASIPARVRPGTTILVLSSRDPGPRLGVERRLVAAGFPVRHVAFGPHAPAAAATARRAGLGAIVASLEPDWRTSDALAVVG